MDVLVIGAGVVGLAVARGRSPCAGHAVIVAEATDGIGNGVSSRNSEVIHGGMYYPAGSLRARHCVAGRRLLYAFCESHGVPHRRCGKLIVATNDARTGEDRGHPRAGHRQRRRGTAVPDRRARPARLEPHLACTAALLSPETGIIDSHAFMLALQGDLESAGGAIAFHTPVEAIDRRRGGLGRPLRRARAGTLAVDAVVNAAGLGAQSVARATEGYPPDAGAAARAGEGQLFRLSRHARSSRG